MRQSPLRQCNPPKAARTEPSARMYQSLNCIPHLTISPYWINGRTESHSSVSMMLQLLRLDIPGSRTKVSNSLVTTLWGTSTTLLVQQVVDMIPEEVMVA